MKKIRFASLSVGLAFFVVCTIVSLVLMSNAFAAPKDSTKDAPTMIRGRVLVNYLDGIANTVDIIEGSGFSAITYPEGGFDIVFDKPFNSPPTVFVNSGDKILERMEMASLNLNSAAWTDRFGIHYTFPGFTDQVYYDFLVIGEGGSAKDGKLERMFRGRIQVTYADGLVTDANVIEGSGFTVTTHDDYFDIVLDDPFVSPPTVFVNLGDKILDRMEMASSTYHFVAYSDHFHIGVTFPGFSGQVYFDFLVIGLTQ